MTWYNTFNDVFWITVISMFCTGFGLVMKSILKSKCSNCSFCCGLINIQRDVRAELEAELTNLNQPNNNNNLESPTNPQQIQRNLTVDTI